jgi:hypothetical protein
VQCATKFGLTVALGDFVTNSHASTIFYHPFSLIQQKQCANDTKSNGFVELKTNNRLQCAFYENCFASTYSSTCPEGQDNNTVFPAGMQIVTTTNYGMTLNGRSTCEYIIPFLRALYFNLYSIPDICLYVSSNSGPFKFEVTGLFAEMTGTGAELLATCPCACAQAVTTTALP